MYVNDWLFVCLFVSTAILASIGIAGAVDWFLTKFYERADDIPGDTVFPEEWADEDPPRDDIYIN